MAKFRATPGKPTASTVETVDVLNSSKKDLGSSFMKRRKAETTEPAAEENPQGELIRTSPRKTKEAPLPAPRKSGLRRPTRSSTAALADVAAVGIPTAQEQTGTQTTVVRKRKSVFDLVEGKNDEEAATTTTNPPPRKQRKVNRQASKHQFPGHYEIEALASSPAKGTRSHDKSNKTTATGGKAVQKASHRRAPAKGPGNVLIQAAEQIPSAEDVVAESRSSPKKSPGRPREVVGQSPGRSRKVTKDRTSESSQEEVITATEETSGTGDEQDDTVDEDEEIGDHIDSSPNDAEPEPTTQAPEAPPNANPEAKATVEFEQAASIYDCRNDWMKVLIYADLQFPRSKLIDIPDMKDVIKTIKRLDSAYDKILDDESSTEDLHAAELDIEAGLAKLQSLRIKITKAVSKEWNPKFVQNVYMRIIPKMANVMEAALRIRLSKAKKEISVDALSEIVELINFTIHFHDLADQSRTKYMKIETAGGAALPRLAATAVYGLKRILKNYSKAITEDEQATERERKADLRKAEIARQLESNATTIRQRLEAKEEAYRRKLQEEREKNAEAARRSATKRLEQDQQWKQELMSNRSVEAARLRRKFNLPYQPLALPRRDHGAASDVMDVDEFNFDNDVEGITLRPAHDRLSVDQRARARRELTEDIPAPVTEPVWTEEQMTALMWGLQAFRGMDRYQNILDAPEVQIILDGKNELDLMQQALYIKQSMSRALDTGIMPNGNPLQGDWSWLRSVEDEG